MTEIYKKDYGHDALIYDLKWILERVQAHMYHDFKNETLAFPKKQLAEDLEMLIKRVKDGKYDN